MVENPPAIRSHRRADESHSPELPPDGAPGRPRHGSGRRSTPRASRGGRGMNPTRRDFLKAGAIGGAAATVFGFDLAPAAAQVRELKIARAPETRSTWPYCSVSCGVIIYTLGDKAKNVTPQVVHVEGDPDHPINKGTLCPKGSSLEQDILNPRRLTKPQVRRPGGTDWEDISWDDAINKIGRSVKRTRDATFVEKDSTGNTVN